MVAATALAVAVGIAIPTAPAIQATLSTAPREGSILPANLGVGVRAVDPVVLRFPGPMSQAAVAAGLGLSPPTAVSFVWSADASSVALVPEPRWAVDERYVIHLPAGTAMADGGQLEVDWRASFTTQAGPRVVHLAVTGVEGTPTAETPIVVQDVMAATGYPDFGLSAATDDVTPDASAATRIGLTFTAAMDHAATERAFRITPLVAGSFDWEGTTLWFVPDGRLAAGSRYAISLAGARDADDNPLGGDTSFSFTTRGQAQALTVSPAIWGTGIDASTTVTITFSQLVDQTATAAAFTLTDAATGQPVAGTVSWDAAGVSLVFTPSAALGAGRAYTAVLGPGARDADGNPVTISWQFTTAGPARTFTPVPVAAGSSSMAEYALNQINAARASYGFAPLVLDAAISAVAYAHAADMLANGYFSHNSLDGTTYKQRLTQAGISYGYSGENQCYLGYGGGVQATLDWCHAQFWAEPYPGGGNHKDNILNPYFRRVGIGIATGGSKVIVVWDFTD